MYQKYKTARDTAWRTLIETKTDALPVNLAKIAEHYNIKIYTYKTIGINDDSDGFCTMYNGKHIIFYNQQKPVARVRFTIAHELGHCLLGHLAEGQTTDRVNAETLYTDVSKMETSANIQEMQANVFARDILMPATVLHGLNVQTPAEIAGLCNVSMQSAEIRYERLLELNKRGMYNRHPLERQVYEQFKIYIEESNTKR